MFEVLSTNFLIAENIELLKSGPYMIDISKKYIISEDNGLKLLSVINHSILFSSEIEKQTGVCVKGLMVVLDLFKLHNIFVDDKMNLDKDIKWANYKTSAIVGNMFKYIIDSISAVGSMASTASSSATPNITLKCTIARIFYNKKKMLFFILLLIIGVEYYEKGGYTFKTGGGDDNCNNFANKLYKLMHEFFFDSIPSKHSSNCVRKLPIRRKGSIKRKVVDDNSEEYISVKRNCTRNNSVTTIIQTRSGISCGGGSIICGGGSIIFDNITEIFKYDSEIFDDPLLQNGKDLIVPFNIFEL